MRNYPSGGLLGKRDRGGIRSLPRGEGEEGGSLGILVPTSPEIKKGKGSDSGHGAKERV